MLNADGTVKLDRRFRAFRAKKDVEIEEGPALDAVIDKHKDERLSQVKRHKEERADVRVREIRAKAQEEFTDESALIKFIEETANDIFDQVTLDEHKIEQSLEAKSIKSGVELEIVQHVYEEAMETYVESDTMDIHQWAFSCVNATIANMDEGKKGGLWDNIHKKRKSGRPMRKPGEKGAPTDQDFKDSQEGASADARRAMSKDKDLRRGKDSADDDDSATDDDVKAASKNIMMQLRKSISLKGRFDVEFGDKKKTKIPAAMAHAVTQKYNSLKKPVDKEKFQAKIAKSYKDMLKTMKEGFKPSETILERMNRKLRENKNG